MFSRKHPKLEVELCALTEYAVHMQYLQFEIEQYVGLECIGILSTNPRDSII